MKPAIQNITIQNVQREQCYPIGFSLKKETEAKYLEHIKDLHMSEINVSHLGLNMGECETISE